MEATKIKMNMDGTIRAKVLQYKSDGNTLTEKRETLTKLVDGVYYAKDRDNWDNVRYAFIFEDNGIFWYSLRAATENQFNNPKERERIINLRKNFRAYVKETAQNNGFIRSLEIEVFKRLGEDTASLYASREAYLKNREEEERKRAEEAERRERERKEAEERRKADLLADGKEKLMNHERITVEQIELIAEAVGYKINIRTIGFMREKVTEAVLREDDTVTVWGRKLTSRNIDGTAKVMHELCDRLKAQAEEEAKQAAQTTEMPQIPTETSETVNVLVNGEKETEREEIEVQTIADMVAIGESLNKGESVSFKLHLHFLWSVTITNESAEWCEEFKYSLNAKCLDNPQSFGRRYTSFGLAILHCLNQFNENVNIRDDYETLSAVLNNHQNLISDFRAPQSPETPQAVECAAEPCKLAQTA